MTYPNTCDGIPDAGGCGPGSYTFRIRHAGPFQNGPASAGPLFLASGHSEPRRANTKHLSSVTYYSIA